MATGEMQVTTSQPPPYSTIDNKGGGQAPYPTYPPAQGGYPPEQMNAPYPGGYPPQQMNAPYPGGYPPPPGPGAYPPAGYPPPPGYPQPVGGYSQSPPGPGFYPATQQPMAIHTMTTTTVIVHPGDRCVRCSRGRVEEHFTAGGICCAICLFPCGIICCLSSRVRSCNKCGAIYM